MSLKHARDDDTGCGPEKYIKVSTLEAVLSCEVCFTPLDAKKHFPISLRCGHTLCSISLPRLRQMQCPECRAPISKTYRNVARAPKNFKFMELLQLPHEPPLSTVTNASVVYCSQEGHATQELIVFCQPCQIPICVLCVTGPHNGHLSSELKTVWAAAKADLHALHDQNKDIEATLTTAQQQVAATLAELEGHVQRINAEMNSTFRSYRQRLDIQENTTLVQLQLKRQAKHQALTAQHHELTVALTQVRHSLEQMTQNEAHPIRFLQALPQLRTTLAETAQVYGPGGEHVAPKHNGLLDCFLGEMTSSFPVIFDPVPDPLQCTLADDARGCLTVVPKNATGQPCGWLAAELEVKMVCPDHVCNEPVVLKTKQEAMCSYQIQHEGPHSIQVKINNVALPQSPMALTTPFVRRFGTKEQLGMMTCGMAIDTETGQVCVTSYDEHRVSVFGRDGTLLHTSTCKLHPYGVCFDVYARQWIVTRWGSQSTTSFTPTLKVAHAPVFTQLVGLEDPVGVAMFRRQLFVVNAREAKVLVYDADHTRPILRFGGGELNDPRSIAISDDGFVFVGNFDAHLSMFDAHGAFLRRIDLAFRPKGVALCDRYLAVSGSGSLHILCRFTFEIKHRITAFRKPRALSWSVTSSGAQVLRELYVTDVDQGCIHVLRFD